jgi:glyoxylase-like metal-dependent hydrolase (beta-lactamase superfamily II)
MNSVRAIGILALFCMQLTSVMNAHAQGRKMEGDIESVQVRDNIHMFVMEPAGNVAVSVGEDGVALVDDQFAPMTERIQTAVAELTDKPIRYVFNTHWHGDHTGSNQNFGKQGIVIVAHDNVRQRMSAEQFHLFFKARSPASPPEALPVITFNDTMTFYFNGDVIDIVHMPNAHTDGDSVLHFRNADVIHTGDVFINRGYPLIDMASDGSIQGQITATNRLLDMMGPDTIVIPGHGPLADKARVLAIRDMLVTARMSVAELISQGKTLDEIIAAKPLAELDPEWGQGFVRAKYFVQIIYQSETGDWEKPEGMPLVP